MYRVSHAVHQQRLDAAVGEEDLGSPDFARGGVALLGGRQVLAQLARDPCERSKPEHAQPDCAEAATREHEAQSSRRSVAISVCSIVALIMPKRTYDWSFL